jgi:hypothetical protein
VRGELGYDFGTHHNDSKVRSADGSRHVRAMPGDIAGHTAGAPHIHLENMDSKTGKVLINNHLILSGE